LVKCQQEKWMIKINSLETWSDPWSRPVREVLNPGPVRRSSGS
jgi:hypothetical protein